MVNFDPSEYASLEQQVQELSAEFDAASKPESVIYRQLDAAVRDLEEQGINPVDVLPKHSESGIGFSLRQTRDGKTFWEAVLVTSRETICDPEGSVRNELANFRAKEVGAGSLVAAILTSLGLPVVAIPVAVTIAAYLTSIGIGAFCTWTSAPPDGPA